jgi:hypothetical protein
VKTTSFFTLLFTLLIAAPWPNEARSLKRVFIDQASGLEPFLAVAIQYHSNFLLATDPKESDFVVYLEPRFPNLAAQRIYSLQTGRQEDAVLVALDKRDDRVVVEHEFRYSGEAESRERAAQAFVRAMRKLR